jgi:hypothetical protein
MTRSPALGRNYDANLGPGSAHFAASGVFKNTERTNETFVFDVDVLGHHDLL